MRERNRKIDLKALKPLVQTSQENGKKSPDQPVRIGRAGWMRITADRDVFSFDTQFAESHAKRTPRS